MSDVSSDVCSSDLADALRGERGGFLGKADAQLKQQKLKGDHALAAEMLTAMGDQVARLAEPAALESLVAAARRLARSRWVYCLGLRSSHPAAWQIGRASCRERGRQ